MRNNHLLPARLRILGESRSRSGELDSVGHDCGPLLGVDGMADAIHFGHKHVDIGDFVATLLY